jgi:hypothetical protein
MTINLTVTCDEPGCDAEAPVDTSRTDFYVYAGNSTRMFTLDTEWINLPDSWRVSRAECTYCPQHAPGDDA